MSLIVPNLNESVIVRSAEAEVIGRARPLSGCWPTAARPAARCRPSGSA
jgi:hypothetical protein